MFLVLFVVNKIFAAARRYFRYKKISVKVNSNSSIEPMGLTLLMSWLEVRANS